jgi:hypothetical protein
MRIFNEKTSKISSSAVFFYFMVTANVGMDCVAAARLGLRVG